MKENRKAAERMVAVPIYRPEKEYYEKTLLEHDKKGSRAIRALARAGIKRYCEDSKERFGELPISVPTYAPTELEYKIFTNFRRDSSEYKFLERMSEISGMPFCQIVRFFVIYEWRYPK